MPACNVDNYEIGLFGRMHHRQKAAGKLMQHRECSNTFAFVWDFSKTVFLDLCAAAHKCAVIDRQV